MISSDGTSQTQAFCPYCGHTDDPSEFLTEEQKEYMLSVVGNQVTAGKADVDGLDSLLERIGDHLMQQLGL